MDGKLYVEITGERERSALIIVIAEEPASRPSLYLQVRLHYPPSI